MSSKNHDAIPVPTVEVYARCTGQLDFTCPNCGQQFPLRPMPWRRAFIQCDRCRSKYQLGVGFNSQGNNSPAYLMGKWNSYCANAVNPTGTPFDGIRYNGTVEWVCPRCNEPQSTLLGWNKVISCIKCAAEFAISALAWRMPNVSRLKLKAPFDSLIPRKLNVQATPTSDSAVLDSAANSLAGAPNSSAGGHS